MAEQDERTKQALAYIRHQASKSIANLRILAERTAADCRRRLEGITEEQARFKPGNEWSVKEVLDHLIYSTAKAVIEPVRDLGAGKIPKPFTPDNSGGCATQRIQELRQQMGRLLEQTVALVGSLREGETARATWQHPSLGPLNLKELIALHRLHIMDHVQQIEKIKADPGYPRDERR